MNDLVGPWVRRFLVEYVIGERNYSPNTQHSYRDTFRLLLPLAVKQCRCTVENLTMNGIKPKLLREFTRYLEQVRHCGPSTINQRLAALRAWSRFVAANSPEHLEWSTQLQTVHLKKHAPAPVSYLEKDEMQALLSQPNRHAAQGIRDHALLLFLYNTGARASEVSRLTVEDLDLVIPMATLHGKGRKTRQCPLWKVTAEVLRDVVRNRSAHQGVFLNRNGESLTRKVYTSWSSATQARPQSKHPPCATNAWAPIVFATPRPWRCSVLEWTLTRFESGWGMRCSKRPTSTRKAT